MAVLITSLSAVTVSLTSTAATTATSVAAASDVEPMINVRPCNTSERPKQIRLVLAPGAVLCHEGTVGHNNLDNLYVQSVVADGYTGILWCNGGATGWIFNPVPTR